VARARPASRQPAAGEPPGARDPGGLLARRRGRLRALPSVDEVVRALDGGPALPRARVVEAVRTVLAERRRAVLAAGSPAELEALALETPHLLPRVRAALDQAGAWGLDRVVNATGVVLHTNLGRAPLGPSALARLALVAARYTNLELDVRSRGLARRQQQRRGGPAGAGVSRARTRGRGVPGRADRDRRRVPDPGHHGAVRRPAG
jgi:L-seryl-tRNA selenium transferase/selenocysteine synthase-like protein